ncbi:FeoA family protein [Thermovibrio sp.]
MTLFEAKEGREVKVIEIEGGHGIKNRLAAIGIFPGATLKVLKAPPGPVIVEVSGCKVAIGQGMAKRVRVEEV